MVAEFLLLAQLASGTDAENARELEALICDTPEQIAEIVIRDLSEDDAAAKFGRGACGNALIRYAESRDTGIEFIGADHVRYEVRALMVVAQRSDDGWSTFEHPIVQFVAIADTDDI